MHGDNDRLTAGRVYLVLGEYHLLSGYDILSKNEI